jgi:hypothetical protein
MKPETVDQMLDAILQWKKSAQDWEQTAHELAAALKDTPPSQKQIDAITNYNRQLRRKYRTPRVK